MKPRPGHLIQQWLIDAITIDDDRDVPWAPVSHAEGANHWQWALEDTGDIEYRRVVCVICGKHFGYLFEGFPDEMLYV